jgi:hypothetical protein
VIPIFSDIFRKSLCYAQLGCAADDIAALINNRIFKRKKWNSPSRNPAIPSLPFDLGTTQRTPVVLPVKLHATLILELVEELIILHHTINQNKSLQDAVLSLVIVVATQATVQKKFDAQQIVKHE